MLARVARRIWTEERGQSMFVAAGAILATLLVSALAIDTASWYQKHHQTQVAADSASLAAANCLAVSGPGKTCTSPTDTTDAITVAESIAAANGLTISAGDVKFNGDKVTVTPGTAAPALFARIAGVNTASESADAAASYVPATTRTSVSTYQTTSVSTGTVPYTITTTTTDTTPYTLTDVQTTTTPISGSPLALFAMDSNCSDNGVYIDSGGNTVDGGIFSNSSIWLNTSTFDSVNYGAGSGCKYTPNGGSFTYNDGYPSQAQADVTSWPVAYNTAAHPLPSCTTYDTGIKDTGGSMWQIGNQPANTPQVFCAVGTGNKSDPSTWNGAIQLTGWQSYTDDSYICGTITMQGGGFGLAAENYPTNKLLIYANGTGEAVNLTNGNGLLNGDVETPNGNIFFDSGGNGFDGLLEGQKIDLPGGGSETFYGDGPTTYGYTTTTQTVTTQTTTTSTQTITTSTNTTTTQTVTGTVTTTSTQTVPGSDGLVQ